MCQNDLPGGVLGPFEDECLDSLLALSEEQDDYESAEIFNGSREVTIDPRELVEHATRRRRLTLRVHRLAEVLEALIHELEGEVLSPVTRVTVDSARRVLEEESTAARSAQ